jgi:hypothetical protein
MRMKRGLRRFTISLARVQHNHLQEILMSVLVASHRYILLNKNPQSINLGLGVFILKSFTYSCIKIKK